MTQSRDYLEMAYRSIECFSNDGKLNVTELRKLLAIAERDGAVDDNERRVLRSILDKLNPAELTPDMRATIVNVRQRAGL